MKVALAFSTKDRVELTERTLVPLRDIPVHLFWNDGSITETGRAAQHLHMGRMRPTPFCSRVTGGADAAIVFALTQMLKDPTYTHVGLLENDVLLPVDWYERVVQLFEAGARDGLAVGAVSARTYEDRILIQQNGYAVLHNAGAGHIVFTREAAQLVLDYYRTGWWHDNRRIFAQLSGLDPGVWGAFRTHDANITADWHWDTILAAHGYATLGLTPSNVEMIGQDPPLEDQGLVLARGPVEDLRNETAFRTFVHHTRCVREGLMKLHLTPWMEQRGPNGANFLTYFAHQLSRIGANFGTGWTQKWAQGFGPFSYVADKQAIVTVPVFGPCVLIVSGGKTGSKLKIVDTKSGYEMAPDVAPEGEHTSVLSLQVPGGNSYRELAITAEPGLRLFALQTNEPQPWYPQNKFDFNTLPPVKE